MNSACASSGPRVLVVSSDDHWRGACARELEAQAGCACVAMADLREARKADLAEYDLIVADLGKSPGRSDAARALAALGVLGGRHRAAHRPSAAGFAGGLHAGPAGASSSSHAREEGGEPIVVIAGPSDDTGWVLEAIERGAADAVARRELLGASAGLAAERTIARAMREQRRRAAELELRAALSRLSSKNEALEARVCKLESEAWTDPLTGLANRRQLESVLEQMYAEAVRYDAELAVFMIDLDGFKAVNDQMGHGIGDELLRLVGRVIPDSVRASDVAARYGGDEFVVLMPRTDSATAMGVAQRLAGAFDAQARAWQDARGVGAQRDALVSMSIGVASLRLSEPDEAQTLLEHADRALYAGKRSGKGRVVLFEPPDRRSLPKLSA